MPKIRYNTMVLTLRHDDEGDKICICDFSVNPCSHTLCGAPIEGGVNSFGHRKTPVGRRPDTSNINYVTCPDCMAKVEFVRRVINNEPVR